MPIERISDIPINVRESLVAAVYATIPVSRIEFGGIRGNRDNACGLVVLNNRPFYFIAQRMQKRIDFVNYKAFDNYTNWGFVHAPHEPGKFNYGIYKLPFTTTLGKTEEDMLFVLTNLGVPGLVVSIARRIGKLGELYYSTLKRESHSYESFYRSYSDNFLLHAVYGTAISRACDEAAAKLHL